MLAIGSLSARARNGNFPLEVGPLGLERQFFEVGNSKGARKYKEKGYYSLSMSVLDTKDAQKCRDFVEMLQEHGVDKTIELPMIAV